MDIALLIVRLAFGTRLIYGTIDNIVSWERMLEFSSFLEVNGFPLPLVSAIVSVYAQFLAGLCWILGFKVKEASAIMILNFLVAIIGFHLIQGDSYLNTAPAVHLLAVAILLFSSGAGDLSLKKMLSK